MIWLFNIFALGLIALVVWWFWLSKPQAKKSRAGSAIEVTVENGVYTPAVIEAKVGESLKFVFIRKDPSPCAEKVVFPALGISHDLALNHETPVAVSVDKAGIYEFTCQMAMYRGKLIVS